MKRLRPKKDLRSFRFRKFWPKKSEALLNLTDLCPYEAIRGQILDIWVPKNFLWSKSGNYR